MIHSDLPRLLRNLRQEMHGEQDGATKDAKFFAGTNGLWYTARGHKNGTRCAGASL